MGANTFEVRQQRAGRTKLLVRPAVMTRPEERVASFYRAFILRDAARVDPEERDWQDALTRIACLPFEERVVNGMIFEPTAVDGHMMLGIHKPIRTDFMTSINDSTQQVSDLLAADGAEGQRFANSTAVHFVGLGNVFAIATGSGASPRNPAVADFLQAFAPPGEGAHWKTEPFLDRSQIEQFNQAKGAVEFSSRFSTQRDLFSPQETPEGFVTFSEKIAEQVGGDVEIKISIRLAPEARGAGTKKNFQNLIKRDLWRTAARGSNAKAKAVISEGVEEELSLVAHKLAATIELPSLDSERRQFSHLLEGLKDVGGDMENKVKEILEA